MCADVQLVITLRANACRCVRMHSVYSHCVLRRADVRRALVTDTRDMLKVCHGHVTYADVW